MEHVRHTHTIRGIVCALLGGVLWGLSGACAELLTGEMGVPIPWLIWVRMLGAAFIFIVVCIIKDGKNFIAILKDGRSLASIAVYAVAGVLFTQVAYMMTVANSTAGTATVLERVGLVFIVLFVCFRIRRLPSIREVIGLCFAIAGTVLIATQGRFGELAIAPEALLWGGLTAVAFALYSLLPAKVLSKWGSLLVSGIAMFIASVITTVVVAPWNVHIDITPFMGAVLAIIVLLGTVAAYLLYLQGVADAGPIRAGLVGSVELVAATGISAVWLGTQVSAFDIAGMLLIIAMVLVTSQKSEEKKPVLVAPYSTQEAYDFYEGATDDLPLFEGRASVLGLLHTRKATHDDYPRMKQILAEGREAMLEYGIKEGLKRYPSSRRIMRSITEGSAYVVVDSHSKVVGLFSVEMDGDPSYANPIEGTWLTDWDGTGEPPYAALHWVRVAKEARRGGISGFILHEAERIAREAGKQSIRADIYEQNLPMRRILMKAGFELRGTLTIKGYLDRYKTRSVFEKALK